MSPRDFTAPPPSPELLRAVTGRGAARTRRPRAALATSIALSLACGAAIFYAAHWWSLRVDFRYQPLALMIVVGAAWALGFVAPLALALVPPRGQVLPRIVAARRAALGSAAILIALALATSHVVPGKSWVAEDRAQLLHSIFACLGVGLAVAFAPLVAGMIALRRALPVGARAVGAALGAGGGALGGLFLHLHCSWAQPLHVAFGHGGAVVVGALVGALIAPLAIDSR